MQSNSSLVSSHFFKVSSFLPVSTEQQLSTKNISMAHSCPPPPPNNQPSLTFAWRTAAKAAVVEIRRVVTADEKNRVLNNNSNENSVTTQVTILGCSLLLCLSVCLSLLLSLSLSLPLSLSLNLSLSLSLSLSPPPSLSLFI